MSAYRHEKCVRVCVASFSSIGVDGVEIGIFRCNSYSYGIFRGIIRCIGMFSSVPVSCMAFGVDLVELRTFLWVCAPMHDVCHFSLVGRSFWVLLGVFWCVLVCF